MNEDVRIRGLIGRADWDEFSWEPFRPGVRVHWFYQTGPDGPASALLRYEPGSSVPLHEHMGFEHILVLAGSQTADGVLCKTGGLMISPPGTRHAIASPEGCVVLAVWERPVKILGA